jgi:hypothetical protein
MALERAIDDGGFGALFEEIGQFIYYSAASGGLNQHFLLPSL